MLLSSKLHYFRKNNLDYESIIERLVNHLEAKGLKNLAQDDENIVDSLWLAWQIKQKKVQEKSNIKSQKLDPNPNFFLPNQLKPDPPINPEKFVPPPDEDKQSSHNVPLTVDTEGFGDQETDFKGDSQYLPFKTPKAPALQNKLQISRSLRPLKRKVPSIKRQKLDIDATINLIIEQDIWFPVTKPELERWLDLELIIEQNKSVFIWEQTINELEEIFRGSGIFRRVRTWNLNTINENDLHLTIRRKDAKKNQGSHNYQELIQSNQRSLILLVSHCVSSIWQHQKIYQWLKKWSDKIPVTILQLLPERLWLDTELGYGYAVKFSAFNAGVANSQLVCQEKLDVKQSLNLPVVILKKEYLSQWAKVMAGHGSTSTSGIVFDFPFIMEQFVNTEKSDSPDINNSQAISPDKLVDIFLDTASSEAKRLAGFMAGVPVDLEVVYLIQKNLLPKPLSPVPIAEVFLSGMIERVNKSENIDKAQYNFVQGVRKLLNQAMPLHKTEEVLDLVSKYIAKQLKLDLSINSFRALLSQSNLSFEKEQKLLPFAMIAIEVLANMGGKYAQFAEEIKSKRRTIQVEEIEVATIKVLKGGEEELFKELQRKLSWFNISKARLYQHLNRELANLPEIYRTAIRAKYFPELTGGAGLYQPMDWKNLSQFAKDIAQEKVRQQKERIKTGLNIIINNLFRNRNYLSISEGETVFVDKTGTIIERKPVQAYYYSVNIYDSTDSQEDNEYLENKLNLDMVYIPGGTFMMGTEDEEIERLVKKFGWEGYRREKPQHQVTVTSFYMSKYPITQGQWKAIALRTDLQVNKDIEFPLEPSSFDKNPQSFSFPTTRSKLDLPAYGENPKRWHRPVEKVNWYQAKEFCDRLSLLTGKEYRLPTEAEWEYACRAIQISPSKIQKEESIPHLSSKIPNPIYPPFHFGETITSDLANYSGDNIYTDEPEGVYRQETTPVGMFPPNAFGLYDMHGNVLEWCADTSHDNYKGAPKDGSAWITEGNNTAVLRGGSWADIPYICRSTSIRARSSTLLVFVLCVCSGGLLDPLPFSPFSLYPSFFYPKKENLAFGESKIFGIRKD